MVLPTRLIFFKKLDLLKLLIDDHYYLPQTMFGKVMFLHVSVCPQGGWYPSMPCRSPGRRGSPGPHPGEVSRPTPGVSPGSHLVWDIPAYTEADPPPLTATAAGGTHPTGMHSCKTSCSFGQKLCEIISSSTPLPLGIPGSATVYETPHGESTLSIMSIVKDSS